MSYQLRSADNRIEKLTQKSTYTIGRSSTCDICIDVDAVSNHHAILERDGAAWIITDLGSKNGTFIDELKLEPQTPQELKKGSKIRFNGSAVFTFELVEKPGPYAGEQTIPQGVQPLVDELRRDISDLEQHLGRHISQTEASQKRQAATLREIQEDQAIAKNAREQTNSEVKELAIAFKAYAEQDTLKFEKLGNLVFAGLRAGFLVLMLGGLFGFVTISAADSDDRNIVSKTIDFVGGPGEFMGLSISFLGASAWAVSKVKKVSLGGAD